jgi:C-methyltransferase
MIKFTNYWESFTIYFACKINLFEILHLEKHTQISLYQKLEIDLDALKNILGYLEQEKYIKTGEYFQLTRQGFDFTDSSKVYLKEVCILWHEEHLSAWQNGLESIKTGTSSFEKIYGEKFFDFIESDLCKLDCYHKAMTYYARKDYKELASSLDLNLHNSVLDLGGGYGALTEILISAYPKLQYKIFDLKKTISLAPKNVNIQYISGNFFEPLNLEIDAVFLARILHDWNEVDAVKLLKNISDSMSKKSRLYIVEILSDKTESPPYLLNLNMQFLCDSKERTGSEYKTLLNQSGFQIETILRLNSLQSILICRLI